MSKIPLPLFIFTLIMGRPYPYSFSTNSKTSSSVIWEFPCLGPQNALWIQFENSLLCFLKASYIEIPCHGNCVTVQLVTSPRFTLPLNTVTEMHWLWLIRCWCTFPFNKIAHDFHWIILTWNGLGSTVGIATDYVLDGPGLNPGGDEIFRLSRPALGPTQPPVPWVPAFSRG
jgi:hypothetical protein